MPPSRPKLGTPISLISRMLFHSSRPDGVHQQAGQDHRDPVLILVSILLATSAHLQRLCSTHASADDAILDTIVFKQTNSKVVPKRETHKTFSKTYLSQKVLNGQPSEYQFIGLRIQYSMPAVCAIASNRHRDLFEVSH